MILQDKLIYVAHPYSDNPKANIEAVTAFITRLQHMYPYSTFITPLHIFNFHEGVFSYEATMSHCLFLLGKCDYAIFPDYYSRSKGCLTEIEFCTYNNIPYKVMPYLTLEEAQ